MGGFNTYLEQLAARYRGNEMPWATLNAQGAGLVTSNAYLDLLTQRWGEFQAVTAQYNLKIEQNPLRAAIASLGDSLNEHARVFLDADLMGLARVISRDAFTIPGPLLRALLAATYTQVEQAYFAHTIGTWRAGVVAGDLPLESAEDDANETYRIMGAVIMLHQSGMLGAARESSVGAFGAAPAAAPIAALVLQVALMIAICFVFYEVWRSMERYELLKTCCLDGDGKPTEPRAGWCVEFCTKMASRGDPENDPFKKFMGQVGEGVKWVAILGGSALAFTLMWPLVRRSLASPRRKIQRA